MARSGGLLRPSGHRRKLRCSLARQLAASRTGRFSSDQARNGAYLKNRLEH